MSINYKAIARKNPLSPNDPPKFNARAIVKGKTDIDALAKLIAKESTVSRTDVYAVIIAFLETIITELEQGRMIYLGKLGSMGLTLRSEGAETEEKFTSANILQALK